MTFNSFPSNVYERHSKINSSDVYERRSKINSSNVYERRSKFKIISNVYKRRSIQIIHQRPQRRSIPIIHSSINSSKRLQRRPTTKSTDVCKGRSATTSCDVYERRLTIHRSSTKTQSKIHLQCLQRTFIQSTSAKDVQKPIQLMSAEDDHIIHSLTSERQSFIIHLMRLHGRSSQHQRPHRRSVQI